MFAQVEACGGECASGCDGNWQTAATQLLGGLAIMKVEFCNAIYIALAKGRGKYQNVYIHGPTNCGRSFILSPLKVIYKRSATLPRGHLRGSGQRMLRLYISMISDGIPK